MTQGDDDIVRAQHCRAHQSRVQVGPALGRVAEPQQFVLGVQRGDGAGSDSEQLYPAGISRTVGHRPQDVDIDQVRGLLGRARVGVADLLHRIKMHALLRRLCAAHQPATLLVTHDVEETLVLADRVLVLHEGRFALDARVVDRDRASAGFPQMRARLLTVLGVHEGADDTESETPAQPAPTTA